MFERTWLHGCLVLVLSACGSSGDPSDEVPTIDLTTVPTGIYQAVMTEFTNDCDYGEGPHTREYPTVWESSLFVEFDDQNQPTLEMFYPYFRDGAAVLDRVDLKASSGFVHEHKVTFHDGSKKSVRVQLNRAFAGEAHFDTAVSVEKTSEECEPSSGLPCNSCEQRTEIEFWLVEACPNDCSIRDDETAREYRCVCDE